jgi:hypothetical protein
MRLAPLHTPLGVIDNARTMAGVFIKHGYDSVFVIPIPPFRMNWIRQALTGKETDALQQWIAPPPRQ